MNEPRPSAVPLWKALAAPWVGIVRPSLAGSWMASASRLGFWSSFAFGTVLLAGVHLFLQLWSASFDVDWSAVTATQPSPHPTFRETPLAQVWREWRLEQGIDPFILVLIIVAACLAVPGAALAWLLLMEVHAGGPIWPSYKRSFRAIVSLVGLLTAGSFVIGSNIVYLQHAQYRRFAAGVIGSRPLIDPNMLSLTAFMVLNALFPVWLVRAVRGARGPEPAPPLPPRCEGCGYDLTHVPDSGLCPECGVEVAGFLTPDGGRNGADYERAWKARYRADPWFRSTLKALFQPSRFYSQLQLRTPEAPSRRFAAAQFAAMTPIAFLWAVLGFLHTFNRFQPRVSLLARIRGLSLDQAAEAVCLSTVITCLFLFGAWALHRLVAAVSYTIWLFQHALVDPRWARKIVAYETSFLWAVGIANGVFVTAVAFSSHWLPAWLRQAMYRALQMAPELAVFWMLNGLLFLAWMWRCRLAMHRIRYSNF